MNKPLDFKPASGAASGAASDAVESANSVDYRQLPDAHWRKSLSEMDYLVTRHAHTERPFSGRYWDHNVAGIYRCVCCGTALFASDTKFDAGCGWPSYFAALNPAHVREIVDRSHGMVRKEIVCNVCDAHLGHVFPDGPPPTGLRYCINSASLQFEAA